MKPKEKAKELLKQSIAFHGTGNGKEQALKTIEQVYILAPMHYKEYWNNVKQEVIKAE